MHLATVSLLTLSSLLLSVFCQGNIKEISKKNDDNQQIFIRPGPGSKKIRNEKDKNRQFKVEKNRNIVGQTETHLKNKLKNSNVKTKQQPSIKRMLNKKLAEKKNNKDRKKSKVNKKIGNRKQVEPPFKSKHKPILHPEGKRTFARESDDTCTGTSLGDSCLTNLKAAMKYDRDKITTFKNQLERAESFDKIIGKKAEKSDDFFNSTTYLLIALGGNVSSLNCSGNPTKSEDAIENYNTLANCSTTISTGCLIPSLTAPNFTELNVCKDFYADVEAKNDACLKMKTSNGTELCECWSKAAGLVVDAKTKTKTGTCDAQTSSKDLLTTKKTCLDAFQDCKKAEDSSVFYIMTCAGSSNLSFNTTATNTTSKEIKKTF